MHFVTDVVAGWALGTAWLPVTTAVLLAIAQAVLVLAVTACWRPVVFVAVAVMVYGTIPVLVVRYARGPRRYTVLALPVPIVPRSPWVRCTSPRTGPPTCWRGRCSACSGCSS